MQIVIDIPNSLYANLSKIINGSIAGKRILDCVKNSTPLPKGHGRLIDADEAIKTLKSLGSRDYRREKGTIQEAIKMLSFDEYTPTIIEADKAESEGGTQHDS